MVGLLLRFLICAGEFPFMPEKADRDVMMNSVAPVWDGNETWLVLGGGGLLAAFPLAYSIMLPALYIPIILMLIGLILRGVAFEFRFKSQRSRFLWDFAFSFGSVLAALMQGAARQLATPGPLVLYGPYLVDGEPVAPSNVAFDSDLRARHPEWGLRRLADVVQSAADAGLQLREHVAMPANNLLLVFSRGLEIGKAMPQVESVEFARTLQ